MVVFNCDLQAGMILGRGLAGFPQNNSEARLFMERMRHLCPLFFSAYVQVNLFFF